MWGEREGGVMKRPIHYCDVGTSWYKHSMMPYCGAYGERFNLAIDWEDVTCKKCFAMKKKDEGRMREGSE